jgi:hypothetical protein
MQYPINESGKFNIPQEMSKDIEMAPKILEYSKGMG